MSLHCSALKPFQPAAEVVRMVEVNEVVMCTAPTSVVHVSSTAEAQPPPTSRARLAQPRTETLRGALGRTVIAFPCKPQTLLQSCRKNIAKTCHAGTAVQEGEAFKYVRSPVVEGLSCYTM